MVDRGDGYSWITLLLVKAVKLFKKIDLGTGCGLNGVQTLQSCLEAKRLKRFSGFSQESQCQEAPLLTSVSVTKGMDQPSGGIILHIP